VRRTHAGLPQEGRSHAGRNVKRPPLLAAAIVLAIVLMFADAACGEPAAQVASSGSASQAPETQPPVPEAPAASADAGQQATEGGVQLTCDGGEIAPEAAWQAIQTAGSDITVIDIRYANEYEEGHIPGAISMPVMGQHFYSELQALPHEKTYLIFCWHGMTSKGVVYNMEKAGFTHACSIQGGFQQWDALGLPLEPGSS
jgi:rhodanese-related sulfurtransferase